MYSPDVLSSSARVAFKCFREHDELHVVTIRFKCVFVLSPLTSCKAPGANTNTHKHTPHPVKLPVLITAPASTRLVSYETGSDLGRGRRVVKV